MQSVTLLMTEFVTHDVKRFLVERPDGFEYTAGQSVELAIDEPGWKEQSRPFSPTSLTEDRLLEFTIKSYPDHHGITERLHTLKPGARLLLSDPWGYLVYKGPGTFIAGGAGITPFIAMLRLLARDGRLDGHTLIYSNKTPDDIIGRQEFRHYLGERCLFLCTRSQGAGCAPRRIDMELLRATVRDFSQHFYLCGPKPFVREITQTLQDLGARSDALVFER